MSEGMNLSINGQSQVPPGFRFHPTEEELLRYYLRKKVSNDKIDLDVIREVDLNKLEPWDIQEECKIGSTPQNDWYFFSHKDKKYPTGTRTNRATAAGFWKATGRDKIIYTGFKRIGLRKTLVFYKGRAPHGQKSDWIMHEYRLDETTTTETSLGTNCIAELMAEEGWVVCRVFRKKNYQRALDSPKGSSTSLDSKNRQLILSSGNDEALDQMLVYMGRSCKLETDSLNNSISVTTAGTTNNNTRFLNGIVTDHHQGFNERFMHLPRLESPITTLPSIPLLPSCYQPFDDMLTQSIQPFSCGNDWVTLDRLVAAQLNGQVENVNYSLDDSDDFHTQRSICNNNENNNENDLWSFTKSSSISPPSSSSDPLCHLSV